MSVTKKKLTGKRVSWGYEFAVGGRVDRQRYKQGGFATRDEAINAEAAKRLELDRAVKIAATGTLHRCIEQFFSDRGPELSPKTLDRYKELIGYLHVDLLALPVGDVTAMALHMEWKRLRESGGHHRRTRAARPLSAKTVRNIASVVSAACSWAVLYGLIKVNPTTDSKPPSGPKRKGVALAPSQTELMVSAAPAPWLSDFLEVEAGLGIRRGEALALRWSDIGTNPKSGNPAVFVSRSLCQVRQQLIWKGTKMGDDRWVDISDSIQAAFERRRQEQATLRASFPEYDSTSDLIFSDPMGAPLRPDSVSSKVSRLCRLAKLPKGVSLHTLRHTHGSQLVADGADIASVSERLGHSDAGTTLGIYTHAVPGKSNLAKQWEQLQKKKPQ
jgi:integrase